MTKIIELFCGASGLGLGAELAGFELCQAVDIDPILTSSHKSNFPRCEMTLADLSKVEPGAFVVKEKFPDRIAGVIGGPPCQGFSSIGRRDISDKRNELLPAFFRNVSSLQPMFFLMENVPGLMDEIHGDRLEAALGHLAGRYDVLGPILMDAADFGAPTRRKRVIILGYDPEYVDPILPLELNAPSKKTTVRQAISDLPDPKKAKLDVETMYWSASYPVTKGRHSTYATAAREAPPQRLASELTRTLFEQKRVTGLNPVAHSEDVVNRWRRVRAGARDPISRAVRLEWEGACNTLRAGTGSEHGSYQALRPIHPSKHRMITVREAARLQGFPDWFLFHPTIWHSFRMIGNSVSPIFARELLLTVFSRMEGCNSAVAA